MTKKILVITSSIDCTVNSIVQNFSNRVDFFRVDIDNLKNFSFSVGKNPTCFWEIFDKTKKQSITNESILSIYYRKPIFPDLSEFEEAYHPMIKKDIICLINGIVDFFNGTVLTKPHLLINAENKVNQLIYALESKLKIPYSFIGTDNNNIKEYSKIKSIIKPLTQGKIYINGVCESYQTSYFNGYDEDIALSPIYLQKYIKKQYEVRITVINNTFYTVRIDTKNKLDWRMDYENHRYTLIDCPLRIRRDCSAMLKNYNLVFGAFDYIVTPNNDWIFLELNPNGQWLWLEEALDLDISEKIIDYLIK